MAKNLKRPLGIRVSDEAHDRLERLSKQRKSTKTQVIEDALAALDAEKEISQADVIAAIKRNWRAK